MSRTFKDTRTKGKKYLNRISREVRKCKKMFEDKKDRNFKKYKIYGRENG